MELFTPEIRVCFQKTILTNVVQGDYGLAAGGISPVLKALYEQIPPQKRISYGRVHTVKVLAAALLEGLKEAGRPVLLHCGGLYAAAEEPLSKGTALGVLSCAGLEEFEAVLPYFESAATSADWDLRELAQMFFRKLIGAHRDQARVYLLEKAGSPDANMRRFVSETLRPVQENRWFYQQPDYSLGVLRLLFREAHPYPRTSVGNNLSDLARRLPELVYSLVEELMANGDRNSAWIAYRACRNLVKKEPLRVMALLKVEHYMYKTAHYDLETIKRAGEVPQPRSIFSP